MKIDSHRYVLKFNGDFGTVGGVREGALLRVTFDDGLVGYCDCHPWVELGDLPLSQQLQNFEGPQMERSLSFSRLDAEARKLQRSLFDEMEIPKSHKLISLANDPTADFTCFKIKVGRDFDKEIATMIKWTDRHPSIKLRLDFNEKISREEFLNYWNRMPDNLQKVIDFVEDPYKYDPEAWAKDGKNCGVDFAADRASTQAFNFPLSAQVIVHKPAVEPPPQLHEGIRLVVTSYLDHPIGQMCAAYSAAVLKAKYPKQLDLCGLLSHHCYESSPFIEELGNQGSMLIAPKGTGFGFDHLLKNLNWDG